MVLRDTESRRACTSRYAFSYDGINWTKSLDNPVLPLAADGKWDDHVSSYPSVIWDDNTLHIWYTGRDQAVESGISEYFYDIGYASFQSKTDETILDDTVDVQQAEIKIQGGEKGYINPLKGETAKIIFKTAGTGAVVIKIYTTRGQLVREYEINTDGNKETISWDGKNKEGSVVASGIYIVHVKGPGIELTKKIALVK